MKFRSLIKRRPSPAIVISSAALFMSLGGVGYAATSLPSNSVGTSQIRNDAVTYQKVARSSIGSARLANEGVTYTKIAPGAVGSKRANLGQLQARVRKTCAAGSAIGAISYEGVPTCNATLPAQYGATDTTTALSGTSTAVASKALPAGSDYLAFANTQLNVTSGSVAQRVTVSCTLTVGSVSETRSVQIGTTGTTGNVTSAALPLQVAGTSGTAGEACTATIPAGATGTSAAATSGINAIQTASNN